MHNNMKSLLTCRIELLSIKEETGVQRSWINCPRPHSYEEVIGSIRIHWSKDRPLHDTTPQLFWNELHCHEQLSTVLLRWVVEMSPSLPSQQSEEMARFSRHWSSSGREQSIFPKGSTMPISSSSGPSCLWSPQPRQGLWHWAPYPPLHDPALSYTDPPLRPWPGSLSQRCQRWSTCIPRSETLTCFITVCLCFFLPSWARWHSLSFAGTLVHEMSSANMGISAPGPHCWYLWSCL